MAKKKLWDGVNNRYDEDVEDSGGINAVIQNCKAQNKVTSATKFLLGDLLLMPGNTSWSDDYHEFGLAAISNVKPVHHCEMENFIAYVVAYEKIDSNLPAYFVVGDRRSSLGVEFTLIEWA